MQIYDISLVISPSTPVWPGDPRVKIERVSKIEEGCESNVSRIDMGVHTGTHVDSPYHFLGGDTAAVDQLDLNTLVGQSYLLHIPDDVSQITARVLQQAGIPPLTKRLLIKTCNSLYWAKNEKEFREDFVAISADGAQYLVEKDIQLVGVDYLSVAPYHDIVQTHKILLQAGIIIIEGLDLSKVPPGYYHLYCLPIKIEAADGAPARAILVDL